MTKKREVTIDLSKLSPEERKKLERIVRPRNHVFSNRFAREDVESWKMRAEARNMDLREWTEEHLNAARDRELEAEKNNNKRR